MMHRLISGVSLYKGISVTGRTRMSGLGRVHISKGPPPNMRRAMKSRAFAHCGTYNRTRFCSTRGQQQARAWFCVSSAHCAYLGCQMVVRGEAPPRCAQSQSAVCHMRQGDDVAGSFHVAHTVLAGLFLGCIAVLSEAPPLAGVSRRVCRARNSDTRRRELCACRAGAGGSARPGVRAAGLCAVLLAAVVSQNRRSEHTVSLQHRAGEWPVPLCGGRVRTKGMSWTAHVQEKMSRAPSGARQKVTPGDLYRGRAEESWGTIGFAVSAMAQGSAVISGKSRTCGRR